MRPAKRRFASDSITTKNNKKPRNKPTQKNIQTPPKKTPSNPLFNGNINPAMKRILAILPLRVFAALCFAATLAGCAGNAGNGAFPSASPELPIPTPAETSEIHRQQLAQALGNPALADSIAGQAPDALPQISHTPDILDKNPFASPQAPRARQQRPFRPSIRPATERRIQGI